MTGIMLKRKNWFTRGVQGSLVMVLERNRIKAIREDSSRHLRDTGMSYQTVKIHEERLK
jgi:hypothetical protein